MDWIKCGKEGVTQQEGEITRLEAGATGLAVLLLTEM